MRKLISLFLILSLNAYGQSEPITRLKLEGSGTYVPGSSIQVPNNSATKISGSTSRLETGNTNLLSNPSFEATVPSTGWTLTNATSAANTSFKLEGSQSLQVTPTVAGGGIKQSVTLNAASLLGSQGVIEVPVRTSGTDVKVCFLANSVRTYCKDVPAFDASSAFKTIVTPITFDGTSNGIEVYSTGTSVFIVDEIKIGRGLPFQNVNGARLVGTLNYPIATNCVWPYTTSTSYQSASSEDLDCSTPTITGSIKPPSTKIPAIILPAGSLSGTYKIIVSGWFSKTGAGSEALSARLYDGSNGGIGESAGYSGTTNASAIGTVVSNFTYNTPITVDKTISLQLKLTGTASVGMEVRCEFTPLSFQVYYFPPESKIYSQVNSNPLNYNAGTIVVGATTTSPTKPTTTALDQVLVTRFSTSGRIVYNYKHTSTVGAVAGSGDYLFSLPIVDGVQLRFDSSVGFITSSAIIGSDIGSAYVGTGAVGDTGVDNAGTQCILFAYSSTQFRASCYNGVGANFGADALTKMQPIGSSYWNFANATTLGFSLVVDAPIAQWSSGNLITGSFAGIEKCANDYECTDMFSATITNGNAISNQNIPWLSTAVWSPAGTLTLTFNTNLKDGTSALSSNMNCWAIPSTQGQRMSVNTVSTTQVIFENRANDGTANSTPVLAYVYCQKGTNDYKPKTAKVATSIGVPTVPGITTSGTGNLIDVFSVSYGTTNATTVCSASPCSYLDQIGTAVSSITRTSAANYVLNLNKTYTKLKCTSVAGTAGGGLANITGTSPSCSNCNSLAFMTQLYNAIADTYGTLYCIGSY